jgi:hypothetical protein
MSVKLSQAQSRVVNEHQVYHIMRSFLTVSETGEKALPELYSSTKEVFGKFVAADTDLNDDMKTAAMVVCFIQKNIIEFKCQKPWSPDKL